MFAAVSSRPRASLGRILEDLGTTLLDLVCGDQEAVDDIGGVVIYDALDEPVLPRQALVLGVGLSDAGDIARLLGDLGEQGTAGLVVRAPIEVDDEITRAVHDSKVALLTLTRGASWAQLAAMVRSMIAEGDVGDVGPETLAGMPSGDLFALANAISALLDAPVTIEDRRSRVLAFSGRQDEADPSRIETVLGRQVPERYRRILEERGVFRDMYRSDLPVYANPMPGDGEYEMPRVAIAVRAGDEILGSIWAAVRGPLTDERSQALCDATKVVALHLLRLRAGADVGRRLRADLVATALEGGTAAGEALSRLGFTDRPAVVLALAVGAPHPESAGSLDAELIAERARVTDAFAMHLTAVHPQSAAALVGDVAYGIIPAQRGTDAEERALRIAEEFLDRVGARARLLVGIGQLGENGAALARSRTGADRALRVLRSGSETRSVARISDVHVEALLLELRDLIDQRGDRSTGPVSRLLAYDAQHRTCLVDTLRAWLNAFGDVIAASASVHVHPNTFRYRLRRLAEVGELDLTDGDARFAAMLELRLMPRPDPSADASDASAD